MNATQRHQVRGPARRGGFTIIELLMALLLVSTLLTAVALAMRASMDAYEQNRNMANVNQAARSLAMRMQRELRQATAVDHAAGASRVVITPPPGTSGLQQIAYTYTGNNKTLTYSLHYADPSKDITEVLFDAGSDVELSGFFVAYNTVADFHGTAYTRRVICTTYFTLDGQTSPLVFTASPRRNQSY